MYVYIYICHAHVHIIYIYTYIYIYIYTYPRESINGWVSCCTGRFRFASWHLWGTTIPGATCLDDIHCRGCLVVSWAFDRVKNIRFSGVLTTAWGYEWYMIVDIVDRLWEWVIWLLFIGIMITQSTKYDYSIVRWDRGTVHVLIDWVSLQRGLYTICLQFFFSGHHVHKSQFSSRMSLREGILSECEVKGWSHFFFLHARGTCTHLASVALITKKLLMLILPDLNQWLY